MTTTHSFSFHLKKGNKGRTQMRPGKEKDIADGNLPRITRLMALAIKFEKMIEEGLINDYTDLANLGYVSKARITQIMNLRMLDPRIQEAILELPPVIKGKDPIASRDVLRLAQTEMSFEGQMRVWEKFSNIAD